MNVAIPNHVNKFMRSASHFDLQMLQVLLTRPKKEGMEYFFYCWIFQPTMS